MSRWKIFGIVCATIVWLVALVLVVVVPTKLGSVTGTYKSDAGSLVLANDGSAVLTSGRSVAKGRFMVNADYISVKVPGSKRMVFRRVEGSDLEYREDVYAKQ